MEEEINNKRCLPPMDEAPWLVYTHGKSKHKKIQTLCKISNDNKCKSYLKSIPELRGKSILASCYGWLLIQEIQNKEKFLLWNPTTSETLDLPLLSAPDVRITNCTLSDDPRSHNCVVSLFCDGVIYSCRPMMTSSSSWTAQELEIEGVRVAIKQTIALGNVIYGRTIIRFVECLVSLEFADGGTNSLNLTSLRLILPDLGSRHYLLESCGRIYAVSRPYDLHCRVNVVNVWELDLQKMKWVEVNCLGGRAFFVGDDSASTWCWGTTDSNSQSHSRGGVEENCVYIIDPYDLESVYSYRLKDNTLTLLLPCSNLVTPWDCPLWVMPQDKRYLAKPEWKQRIGQNLDATPQGDSTTEYKELPQPNEKQDESFFGELPLHIIEIISKYVHLFDHENFRASCKIFQSAVPAAEWRTNNFLPLLMFFKNDDGLCEVMDPSRIDSHRITLQLPRSNFTIDFSKDGWLLVRVGENPLKFFNPFTGVMGEFPPCELMPYATSIGFSTYPTSPDCLTVGIHENFRRVEIQYHQFGDETWNECCFDNEDIEFEPGISSPIYHAGAFYFLDKNGYLGVFELVGGEASWQVYDSPHVLDGWFYSYHLVECDGELLSVFIEDIGRWVVVFKFNHSRKNWDQVDSLRNHILFIGSSSSSFSVMARDPKMGNKIYLARLKRNEIIFYSLETHKYHVFGSEESMDNFYGTTEPLRCCWV